MTPRKTCLALFALIFFGVTYAHQKQFDAPTPVSRLDLLHALFVQGTVCIDAYHTNTPDKAIFEGSYYSDKAPGTAALALPPFALTATAFSITGIDLDSRAGWLISSWIACAGSIGLITALGGVALFAWLSNHVPPRFALVTILAVFLGAAPLPYSTMMFSHALVVGLLAIAIRAIGRQVQTPDPGTGNANPHTAHRNAALPGPSNPLEARVSGGQERAGWFSTNCWTLLAGFACGWALTSEYSSGLVVAGLFVWLVSTHLAPLPGRDPIRSSADVEGKSGLRFAETARAGFIRAMPFCLAAVPPLLLIPAYSWACFGDPLTLPYTHQASFPEMKKGLYAIQWPDAQTAFNLLFSPARGLFFWTPFFLIAGAGYGKLFQLSPRLFWLTYALPLLHVAVISGRVWDWPAGPAWGPRLLSPMIPLLALPCAYGVWRFPRIGMALAVYSIGVTTLAALTDACPGFGSHPNPLLDLNVPLFREGEFSPNLGMLLGLPPYGSIALYYAVMIGAACWLWRHLSKAGERPASLGGPAPDGVVSGDRKKLESCSRTICGADARMK